MCLAPSECNEHDGAATAGGIFGANVHDSVNIANTCKYYNISPFFICHKISQSQRFEQHCCNMSTISQPASTLSISHNLDPS